MHSKQSSFRAAALAVSLAAGVAASTAASARPGGGEGQEFGAILRTVQLSSAQKLQIHQIMSAAHTRNAPQMTQMRALQQQITSTMLAAGNVTEAQLMPLEQQQESLRQQLDASRLQTALAIRNVLTSAQLAQAASTHAQLASLHQQEHAVMAASRSDQSGN